MEMNLKNIIEKIKEEGTIEAEKQASEIIEKAEQKANIILEDAKKQKQEIIDNAEKEAKNLNITAKQAIQQASRDVILGLKENIIKLFDNILKKEISVELSSEFLQKVILTIIEKFKLEGITDIEVLLNEQDKKNIENKILSTLKDTILNGKVLFKASNKIEKGFCIGKKGENAFYDFTDEALTDSFRCFLNPKVIEILDAKE